MSWPPMILSLYEIAERGKRQEGVHAPDGRAGLELPRACCDSRTAPDGEDSCRCARSQPDNLLPPPADTGGTGLRGTRPHWTTFTWQRRGVAVPVLPTRVRHRCAPARSGEGDRAPNLRDRFFVDTRREERHSQVRSGGVAAASRRGADYRHGWQRVAPCLRQGSPSSPRRTPAIPHHQQEPHQRAGCGPRSTRSPGRARARDHTSTRVVHGRGRVREWCHGNSCARIRSERPDLRGSRTRCTDLSAWSYPGQGRGSRARSGRRGFTHTSRTSRLAATALDREEPSVVSASLGPKVAAARGRVPQPPTCGQGSSTDAPSPVRTQTKRSRITKRDR